MSREQQRRRLDRDQVVEAAEAAVDELGWDQLTVAGLAKRVGAKGPSLYNHVNSLEDLRSELQQRTIRLLGQGLVTAMMGRSGREGLRAIAYAYRAFVQRFPHRYEGMTRNVIDRGAVAVAAQDADAALTAVVRSYGVDEHDLPLARLGLFAALHGAVSLEIATYFADTVDNDLLYDAVLSACERQLAFIAGGRAA